MGVTVSTIIILHYRNNTNRRKIAEALFIKKMKPSLKIQDKSVKLKLFNRRLFQKHFLVKAFVKWEPINSFALYINWLVTA